MASDSIYRVTVRTTSNARPTGTVWQNHVKYCGPSLRDARVAYLREIAGDYCGGFGGCARSTVIHKFEAEPDVIVDQTATELP